jgi:hypothetical protein
LFVDPNSNLWANNDSGKAYSYEVCDPVEAPTYVVKKVSVSNFVTPAWFDPLAPKSATFDKLELLKAPFTLLKGGYVVWASAGKEHQTYGAAFPKWRRSVKRGPMSRTHRRIVQGRAVI